MLIMYLQAETKLCPETGMDSLLHDYGLTNMLKAVMEKRAAKTAADPAFDQSAVGTPSMARRNGALFATPPSSSPDDQQQSVRGHLSPPPGFLGQSALPSAQSRACTSCKVQDALAIAYCYDCTNLLCHKCRDAHNNMQHFVEHTRIVALDSVGSLKIVSCIQVWFCELCDQSIIAAPATPHGVLLLHVQPARVQGVHHVRPRRHDRA